MEDIDNTVREMDDQYDANFGEWVRNEDNLKVVALNLKRYIKEYSEELIVEVIGWIVRHWRIRSTSHLLKELLIFDLFQEINKFKEEVKERALHHALLADRDEEKKRILSFFDMKIRIIRRVMEGWNSLFISEFISSSLLEFSKEEGKIFLLRFMREFKHKEIAEILMKTDTGVDWELKVRILKNSKSGRAIGRVEESPSESPLLPAE